MEKKMETTIGFRVRIEGTGLVCNDFVSRLGFRVLRLRV